MFIVLNNTYVIDMDNVHTIYKSYKYEGSRTGEHGITFRYKEAAGDEDAFHIYYDNKEARDKQFQLLTSNYTHIG